MMPTACAGFYGKTPCKGDFVGRGFSQEMSNKIDTWLQRGLVYSKNALAEQWTQRYMVAPIWRFYLPKNTFDEHYWIGAVIPSVDRVGRYFPLLLAVQLSHPIQSCQAFGALNKKFIEIEELLLDSLEYEFDFEQFCSRIEQLPRIDNSALQTQSPSASTGLFSPDDLVHERDTRQFCIWHSEGSEDIAAQLFLSHGLPEQEQFLTYFTGALSEQENTV